VLLVGEFHQTIVVAIAMFTVVVATLSVNIAANVVSPANDFANAFPRLITFRRGGVLTGLIGILMQPWRLLANPSAYITKWLLGYSGGLGSIAGVLIADYWLVRRTHLDLPDLYLPRGTYSYRSGWNWRAVVATLLGCTLAWAGFVIRELWPQGEYHGIIGLLVSLYDYAWFVGFFVSSLVYLALSRTFPARASSPGRAGMKAPRAS
jgi:NCS1 family nucleobase:cation symporter-1